LRSKNNLKRIDFQKKQRLNNRSSRTRKNNRKLRSKTPWLSRVQLPNSSKCRSNLQLPNRTLPTITSNRKYILLLKINNNRLLVLIVREMFRKHQPNKTSQTNKPCKSKAHGTMPSLNQGGMMTSTTITIRTKISMLRQTFTMMLELTSKLSLLMLTVQMLMITK
jgi:hypothetical protein